MSLISSSISKSSGYAFSLATGIVEGSVCNCVSFPSTVSMCGCERAKALEAAKGLMSFSKSINSLVIALWVLVIVIILYAILR